jgi:uncharacterized protein (TIGR02466 family)
LTNTNSTGHFDLFPTPVAKYHNTDSDALRTAVLEIISNTPKDKMSTGAGNINHYYNEGDLIEHNPTLLDLMSWVKKCVADYAEKFFGVTGVDFIDLNVWINSNSGGVQPGHIHNNSYISATYYVQIDPTKHVGLEFYNPKSIIPRAPLIDVSASFETFYTTNSHMMAVEQGDLLVWPSEVLHGYTQPPVDEPRITLSINFMPSVVKSNLYGFKVSKL